MSIHHKAVFLDHTSLDLGDLDLSELREHFSDLQLHTTSTPQQVIERLQGAQVAITNKIMIDASTFAACPDLKLVLISATGTNNVDLVAAREHGVVVSNCQGYGTASVAQHTLMLLLALATRLPDYQNAVQHGGWQHAKQFCLLDFPIVELEGKTLGMLGYGELGGAVAKLAEAFGMRVLRAEHKGVGSIRSGYTAFETVLRESDAITLHCPLTAETTNLISTDELRAMKASALLINTGRGGLVDERALIQALREGWIAGAGFDVITTEPPPLGHPMLDPALLALPNFLLTPHVAWASRPAMQTLADQLIANIEAFVAGEPRNRVA